MSGYKSDTITVEASGRGSSSTVFGVLAAQIQGGADNDTITISSRGSGISTRFALIGESNSFGVTQGSVIGGGAGDDIIFDEATMDISAIANGIKIVGSQTRNGEAGEWIQEIANVENYSIDGTTYTADTIAQLFLA